MSSTTPAARGIAARLHARDRVVTVTLVTLCQFFHGLTFSAIPLFIPLIREDLQIGFSEAGMLSAAATLSYAFGQVPAGYLADRYGPKRLFFIGLIGWSALSLTLGLVHTFWLALLNQLVAGAFRARPSESTPWASTPACSSRLTSAEKAFSTSSVARSTASR